jgi:hypothetical protein
MQTAVIAELRETGVMLTGNTGWGSRNLFICMLAERQEVLRAITAGPADGTAGLREDMIRMMIPVAVAAEHRIFVW